MKFTIERATLLKTLSHVQSIVEKRNTIPVLSNVRIEAMGDGISFKATDMDTEITEITDAKIAETGATTAPAHMLYDIVRKLNDGSEVELTFPDEKGQLSIASGRSKFSLSTIAVEDFPVISGDSLPINFTMSKEELKEMLESLDENILRAKGMVKGKEGWLFFDYVPEEIDIREGLTQPVGKIVLIGTSIDEAQMKEVFKV